MKNADMPAMPTPCFDSFSQRDDGRDESGRYIISNGLTKREQFCLAMGVADTGDPELDDIIRKGVRQKFAMAAMQGLLSSEDYRGDYISSDANMYAELVLRMLEGK